MRPGIALLFVFSLGAAEIPQGSHVLLRMVNSISTRTAGEGDYVYMKTATPDRREQAGRGAGGQLRSGRGHALEAQRARAGPRGAFDPDRDLDPAVRQGIKVTPHLRSVDSDGTDQKVDKEGGVQQGGSKGADAAKIATTGARAPRSAGSRTIVGKARGSARARAARWDWQPCC